MKLFFVIFLFIFANCLKVTKSLFDTSSPAGILGEIALQYIASLSSGSVTGNLSVVSTSPADGDTSISVSSTINIKFSESIDSTTLIVSTSGTSCSGNLQLSTDDFVTCIPFNGSPTTTDNISFTLTPSSLKYGAAHKIMINTSVKSKTNKILASTYTSPNGFTTTTPCGSNCLVSVNLGVGNNVAAGGHSIVIPSGSSNAGKTLIIVGSSTNKTVLFDPSNATFSQGPNLTQNAAAGANSFAIASGSNNGKILILHAGGLANTSLYDPTTNAMSAGPSFTGNCNTGLLTGANNFYISSGSNSGKTMIVCAVSFTTAMYDPTTLSFVNGPNLTTTPGAGSYSFNISSGVNSGKTVVVIGGSSTIVNIYDPSTNSFSFPNLTNLAAAGAGSFNIATGLQSGKTLVYLGGGGTNTNLYDPSTGNFSAGPATTASINDGSSNFLLSYGSNKDKVMIVTANTTTTLLYDPSQNNFSNGITLPSSVSIGGFSFAPGGNYPTARVIVFGNGANLGAIYFP